MISKKGSLTIYSCGVIMLLLVIISIVVVYLQYYGILKTVSDSLQTAALSLSTENFDETYSSKREGASGGYVLTSDWQDTIDNGKIAEQLKKILKLSQSGDRLVKRDNQGIVHYEISDISVAVYNTPFLSSRDFLAQVQCTVHIVTKSMPFQKTLKATATWQQKY